MAWEKHRGTFGTGTGLLYITSSHISQEQEPDTPVRSTVGNNRPIQLP